ncbi:MAG: transglycosylase SLT domain-containing protein [Candidatus Delongbacteria bacterium]
MESRPLQGTSLAGTRATAGAETPGSRAATLESAGREFERLLVEQMLTAMQETLDEGLFAQQGVGSDWYTSQFNQELSKELTAGPGLGVASSLLRQLRAGGESGENLEAGLDAIRGAGNGVGLASLDRAFELRRREREAAAADPLNPLARQAEVYRALQGAAPAESTRVRQVGSAELRALVRDVAAEVGVDENLALALVQTESGFNSRARSPKGAMGLTQLMPDTARGLGVRDPFDPRQNVKGGLTYLKNMLERYQDRRLALAAYNAGPGAVDRHDGVPPYRETRAYVARIEKLLQEDR